MYVLIVRMYVCMYVWVCTYAHLSRSSHFVNSIFFRHFFFLLANMGTISSVTMLGSMSLCTSSCCSFARCSSDERDWSDTSDTRSGVSDFESDNENEKTLRFQMKGEQWESMSSLSSDRLSSSSSELGDRQGDLIFEYFERCPPYGRTPLAGKVCVSECVCVCE